MEFILTKNDLKNWNIKVNLYFIKYKTCNKVYHKSLNEILSTGDTKHIFNLFYNISNKLGADFSNLAYWNIYGEYLLFLNYNEKVPDKFNFDRI